MDGRQPRFVGASQNVDTHVVSLNVAGYPFVGADVGGFFGNPPTELLVRWYQVMCFRTSNFDTRISLSVVDCI